MKFYITFLLLIVPFSKSLSQPNCNCETELDFVSTKLMEAPSFQDQIKDEDFHKDYIRNLKFTMASDTLINLNCLAYLKKYLKVVRDEHLYIYDPSAEPHSTEKIPKWNKTIESLVAKAKSTPEDTLTGIYNLSNVYEVAVVKMNAEIYNAYIVETRNNKWSDGELKFVLRKTPSSFEGIFYDSNKKADYSFIRFQNGRLFPERWINDAYKEYYTFDPYQLNDTKFEYKKLYDSIHYVRLRSFSGNNSIHNEAKVLLNMMEDNLKSGHVILDLRNNGGGGPRTSDLFKKFFKKRKDYLNIYVIQNQYCGSDCEQFLLKLKDQQTIKTFGENTKGALAYGFGNYSSPSFNTPCYGFVFGITTSKYEQYLPYEVVGIAPDIALNLKEDWIQQVLQFIEKQKP